MLPRKAAEALDLAAKLCERLGSGVSESSEVLCDGELVEGNREDRPLRAHQLRSALAVSGQVSEVLFELLRT